MKILVNYTITNIQLQQVNDYTYLMKVLVNYIITNIQLQQVNDYTYLSIVN
jgi:hypothetical protein